MAKHIHIQTDKRFKYWQKNLMMGLLANDDFYKTLLVEYDRLRESELSVPYLQAKADSLHDLYLPLLSDQIERWAFPSSIDKFEEMHYNFKEFLLYRDEVLLDELERIHLIANTYQSEIFSK